MALENAYQQTCYQVMIDDISLSIRIGEIHPLLDTVVKNSTWCIVTAMNPQSQALPNANNSDRNTALEEYLQERQLSFYLAKNIADNGDWPVEESFFIDGVSIKEACSLAKKFDQKAIVFGDVGSVSQLIWTDGSH